MSPLLNTSPNDYKDSFSCDEKLYSLLQSSNSSISSTSSSSSEDEHCKQVNYHQNIIQTENSNLSESSSDEDFTETCEMLSNLMLIPVLLKIAKILI